MDNWDECISLWSASLSRGGIKPKRTCEEYKRYLIEFLNRPGLQSDPGLVTEARVTEYCFSVDRKGLMPSRGLISMRIASLKNFYKFAVMLGMISNNPCIGIQRPQVSKTSPKYLDSHHIDKLLSVLPKSHAGLRDRAIIMLILTTGLTRSQVLNIKVVDFSIGTKIILESVTQKGDVVYRYIPKVILETINIALKVKGLSFTKMQFDDLLFDIAPKSFTLNLSRYAKMADLKWVNTHVLSHTWARLMTNNNAVIDQYAENLVQHASDVFKSYKMAA